MNENRKEWTDHHARDLFSSSLCTPAQGDVGEIAAALFMLFCGDELRKEKDESLETFSVPINDWLNKMGATSIVEKNDECRMENSISFI